MYLFIRNMMILSFVPSLNLAADVDLDLLRIVGEDKVDKMVDPRLEHESAFIEVGHALGDHLDERHAVGQSLWHNDGREQRGCVLMGSNGSTCALGGLGYHTGR